MASVSIIIPTRNERDNIAKLLQSLMFLKDKGYDYEAVVIDDSTDDTALVASQNGARVILGRRKGLAQAVLDGIDATDSEFIIVMDADLQHPPYLVENIISALSKHDLVVASKHMKGASDGLSKGRRLQSNAAVALTQLLVPIPISDPMAGFFGIRRKCLDGIPRGEYFKKDDSNNDYKMMGIEAIGFKIGLELFAKAKWVSHAEIPMNFKKREAGASKGTRHSLQRHLWRLYKNSLEYEVELPKGSEEYYHFYEGDELNKQWKGDIARTLYKITHEYKPQKTLDAGCGSSPNIRYLYGVDRTGMDTNIKALEFIRNYSIAKFIYGSVLEIPFRDAMFDMVVCCEVLEHLYEKEVEKALSELVRVLQPKGHIILATPNYSSIWWNLIEGGQKLIQSGRWTSDHHTKFNRQLLNNLCLKYGLKEVRYDGVMGNMDMVITYEKVGK